MTSMTIVRICNILLALCAEFIPWTGIAPHNALAQNASLRNGSRRSQDDVNEVLSLALNKDFSQFSRGLRGERRAQGNLNNILQNEYVQGCESFLFSVGVTKDGIISQNDFVKFLLHQCRSQGLCDEKTSLVFEQLEVSIQLHFIKGVCHQEDLIERSNCINDLDSMWRNGNEFGFHIDYVDVSILVRDMCLETYPDVGRMGFTKNFGE